MKTIEVRDGVCGMGKTHMIRQHIKKLTKFRAAFQDTDPKVIFITPYRDEVFKMAGVEYNPVKVEGQYMPKYSLGGKIKRAALRPDDFAFQFESNIIHDRNKKPHNADIAIRRLVVTNKCIAITHTSYFSLSEETLMLIQMRNYHVIIDEVPNVFEVVKLKPELGILEFNTLVEKGVIFKGKDGEVSWILPDKNDLPRYDDLKKALLQSKCRYHKSSRKVVVMIKETPKRFFEIGITTTLMTFLFDGSFCKTYFDIRGLKYIVKDLTISQYGFNDRIRDYDWCVNLYLPKGKLEPMFKEDTAFTSTWYKSKVKGIGISSEDLEEMVEIDPGKLDSKKMKQIPELIALSRRVNSFFKSAKVKANPKFVKVVEGNIKDFSHWPSLVAEFKSEIKVESCLLNERLWSTYKPYRRLLIPRSAAFNEDRFLSFNAKATNSYNHVKMMAYLVNIHPNGDIASYIRGQGGKVDSDRYALSEMMQWIFRSRLREGKKVTLFIASSRMRRLLENWLSSYAEVRSKRLEVFTAHEEHTYYDSILNAYVFDKNHPKNHI